MDTLFIYLKLYIYIYIYIYICLLFIYLCTVYFLIPLFYCCFLSGFGLFKLNTIRSEQWSIECCPHNIVLSSNDYIVVAGSQYACK